MMTYMTVSSIPLHRTAFNWRHVDRRLEKSQSDINIQHYSGFNVVNMSHFLAVYIEELPVTSGMWTEKS